MHEKLRRLLIHLQGQLSGQDFAQCEDLTRRALAWDPVPRLPVVFAYPPPCEETFPLNPHHEVFDDPEKMLFNELVDAFGTSIACRDRLQDDLPCTIRANFGCVIIASMFGGRVEQVEDNPPWIRAREGFDIYGSFRDHDPLDFDQGWCPRVVERYRFYRDALAEYPPLDTLIRRVLPDLQGPIDTAELLRGGEIFVDMYESPHELSALLSVVATAQIGFARHLRPYLSDGPDGYSHQHGLMLPGNILIRGDTSIMVSPQMYQEHIAPHDSRVLTELGGGGMHCCGDFRHLLPPFSELSGLRCIDFGQPEMNDLDAVYAEARRGKIALVRASVANEELVSGAVLDRFPTGVALKQKVESRVQAQEIMSAYRERAEARGQG